MTLQVGIIGMPNVGKSTLLNALTHAHAEASNYPFCTIEKNIGVAAIEDSGLDQLAAALEPEEVMPAVVQFVDIAGLVRGASRGEGLGNKFLGHIREADALIHVVRVFESDTLVHVDGSVDPVRDLEVVQAELMLADLESVERQLDKVRKQAKGNPKEAAATIERLEELVAQLKTGRPLWRPLEGTAEAAPEPGEDHPSDRARDPAPAAPETAAGPEALAVARSVFLLTAKPALLVANIDEVDATAAAGPALSRLKKAWGGEVVPLAIRLEEELTRLTPEEREEMIRELGLPGGGLARLIEASRRLLGLIRFYTIANNKLRAWLIPDGATAPEAAGKIHSDMERGFIRAEVFTPEDLIRHGNRAELHRHGLIRTEGRDYRIREGDVVQILFQAH